MPINGMPADSVRMALLQRTQGDTPRFRTHLLSQRWWLYYWKMFGAPPRYRLDLAQDGRRWQAIVAAGAQAPAILQAEREPFNFEIMPDGSALLKIGSFDHDFKERFLALTRVAFEQMRARHTTTLTIDISENGGGDDDLWREGLMPYLATQS